MLNTTVVREYNKTINNKTFDDLLPAQWIAFSFHNLDSRNVDTNFIAIVVMMLQINLKLLSQA